MKIEYVGADTEEKLLGALREASSLWHKSGEIHIAFSTEPFKTTKIRGTRTLTQNRALHLYFGLLAETLNSSGQDMRKVLKEEIAIPWMAETVKENLWRPIQKSVLGIESTADVDTTDYNKVYEILNRHLGDKLGIHVPWPEQDYEQGY